MTASRTWTLRLAVGLVTSLVGSASAQPDEQGADLLFEQGKILFDAGKYDDACPKLAASFKARPLTGTRGLEAICDEKIDKLASAWAAWRDVRALAQRSGDDERIKVANVRIADLDGKIAKLVVATQRNSVVAGMKISRDGAEVSPELWGAAVPIDRGAHTITVEAPGYETWSTTVEIENGHQRTVDVPVLAGAHKTGPKTEPAAGLEVHPETRSWVGITALAVGGVGIGIGGYLGLKANSNWSDAQKLHGCNSSAVCRDQAGVNLIGDARSNATLSNVFVGAGVAVAAVGLYVWISGRHEAASNPRVTPSAGTDHVGLTFSGGF